METAKEKIALSISRAKADLEEALSHLDRMSAFDASSVSFHAHALNNYLTVAGGTIQLILMAQPTELDPEIRTELEVILHTTDLMSRTVTHLMSMSATADIQVRMEKVDDLPTLVQRVGDFYRRLAAQKTINVNTTSSADVPVVWTDRVAVAAVLDNLLSNAVKYSLPGRQVWLHVRGENGWAVCSVRDEGPGLSEEDQARLFQRGARLTPRPTGNESSTGYGLAVARELIEKLEGTIWCDSELGRGSTFSFRLPAYK